MEKNQLKIKKYEKYVDEIKIKRQNAQKYEIKIVKN